MRFSCSRRRPWSLLLLIAGGLAQDVLVLPVSPGEQFSVTVNPSTWQWYELPLIDAEGRSQAALVTLDAESKFQIQNADVWAKFDVIILNGTLPGYAQTGKPGPVITGNPQCWFDEICEDIAVYSRHRESDRLSLSIGYNWSDASGQTAPLSTAYIGVRESGLAPAPVKMRLHFHTLPFELRDGDTFRSALQPCEHHLNGVGGVHSAEENMPTCRQYFTVPVRSFDVVQINLRRVQAEQEPLGPLQNLSLATSDGGVFSTGLGLVGSFLSARPGQGLLPEAFDLKRTISNLTDSVRLEYFCTRPGQEGTFVFAVVAGEAGDGGFHSEDGVLSKSDPGFRFGRGRFELNVRFKSFVSGALQLNSSGVGPREGQWDGCATYGQNRTYTVQSFDSADSGFYAHVAGRISGLRAKCDGCGWQVARLGEGATELAIANTKCDVRAPANWTFEISMDEFAYLQGLQPTEFVLSVELQRGSITSGEVVLPRSDGGAGFVCCGHVRSWALLDTPRTHAPAVALNVTRGRLRAVFLKHESCAGVVDIDGAVCAGRCYMAWYSLYDTFYGSTESTYSHYLQVPFGPSAWNYDPELTGRREGDWYISVLGLEGAEAEFRMEVHALAPPAEPKELSCNRFELCPRSYYHEGRRVPEGSFTSGGARSRSARGRVAVASAVVLLAAGTSGFLWLLPARGRG